MSKRIEWIDISRFLVIFIMVWAHVGMFSALNAYIHVFHMPIFFMISGYFYKHETYDSLMSLIKKRGKVLIIPYFSFGIILYVFWTLFYYSSGMVEEIIPLNVFFISLFWANTTVIPYSAVQWFITCLFLTEILFYVILKFSSSQVLKFSSSQVLKFSSSQVLKFSSSQNRLIFFMFVSGIIGYAYPLLTTFRLPWGLDVAFSAIVFYGSGYLMKNYRNQNGRSLIVEPKLIYMIGIFIITLPTIYFNGSVNMRLIKYGNILLFYFNAFAMNYLVLLFSKYVEKFKVLKQTKLYNYALYLGRNTIIILLTHRIFDRVFKMMLNEVLSNASVLRASLIYFILTIIIMILMIPASRIVNKYFYILMGRNKKEEKIIATQ